MLTWHEVENERQDDLKDLFKQFLNGGWPSRPDWLGSLEWAVLNTCVRAHWEWLLKVEL